MFQYRQVLVRLRQGESDRDIARSKLMGRRKVAELRALAAQHGWLRQSELPDDAGIAAAIGDARRARRTMAGAESQVAHPCWLEQEVGEVPAVLRGEHASVKARHPDG